MSISVAPELGDAVRDGAERAGPGDRLYTSGPEDLRKLCGAAGNNAAVIGC